MAITNTQRDKLVELYIAYFNRAPEAGGLTHWMTVLSDKLSAGQSEASAMTDISNAFYEAGVQYSDQTGYSATMTDAAFVTKIYENVLGRSGSLAPSAQEVNYWVTAMNGTNPVETGITRATVIERMLSDAKSFANDPTWGWVTDLLNNKTEVANAFATEANSGSLSGPGAVLAGKAILQNVTSDHDSVIAALNELNAGDTFTLQEVMVDGEPGTPPVTAVYWGYTPDYSEVGEGHGVPVQEMLNFITSITGLDLAELGLIDDDGVGPFDNVTSLELEFETGDIDAAGNATLVIGFADGTTANAEVALGEQYFFFLNNLLFDEDGNSRLFEKVIQEGSSGSEDHLVPIRLTPIVNNGGTIETGYTTTGNDTIVAGRLDLLHGAYIDGGLGYNVLEVDAKGTFAQPAQLLNIQEVRVSDQPNFYSDGYDGYVGDSDYPYPDNTENNDSWLDLSRATKIQMLVVSDQGSSNSNNYSGDSDWENDSGNLTIVGVRNGALLRLEGAFTSGTTNIHYGQGLTGTLNVELALGDVTRDINIIQNASVMNINSTGIENHMHVFFAGGSLSRMVVSGTGAFGVDEDLYSSFNSGRPAIIDASANTGGLDVTLNGHYNVKVIGTTADDEITAQDSDRVVITANNGANLIDVDGSEIVEITSGTGNDTITARDGVDVVIVAGDGRNNINADGSTSVDITTGSGNDVISANGAGSGDTFGTAVVTISTGAGNDTITAVRNDVVTIDAGDGANKITVSANEANITTGSGNDTVTISGMDTEFDQGDDENDGSGPGGHNGWNDDNYEINSHFADNVAPGVLMNLDLGAGINTVNLGRDVTDLDSNADVDVEYGVTALEGSTLTGTGIKLFVENHSDITNLDISGATITSVVLKQELRIMLDQFEQIGASNFSVRFDEEGATEDLYIVVSEDTDMSAMLDALPASVRVHVELHNGATLTIDAEDLHTHFAWEGIDATDGLNGKIVINNAGLSFNAFNNGPNNQVIDGGTLSDSWLTSADVTINRSPTGFNRPTQDANVDVTTIDTTGAATMTVVDPTVLGETGNPTMLQIIGNQDLVFAPGAYIDLGDGSEMGNTVDFSALDGTVTGMVVMNFDNLTGGIFGNGTNTRVEVGLGGTLGSSEQGLVSAGVETIVVTSIVDNDNEDDDGDTDTATIWLCDDSQSIQLIGMQGNVNKTLTINEVPWGLVHPTILLEGDGSVDWDDVLKANGTPETSNIGSIEVNYYIAGAPANILIRNEGGADLGVTSTGGERKFAVGSISVTNAKSMNIDVEDGDAKIADINGDSSLKSLDIDAVEDVSVTAVLPTSLTTIDVSGVTGSFQATIDPDLDFTFTGAVGGGSLTFTGSFTADNGVADGTTTTITAGAGGLTLDLADGATVNLDDASLNGITKVQLGQGSTLQITIEQMVAIGADNIVLGLGDTAAILNLSGLADEQFALADFATGISVSLMELADVPAITLHPDTDLTGISMLLVHEGTVLTLTAAQFQQLNGAGAIQGVSGNDFSVVITDLDAASVVGGINLSGITAESLTAQVTEDVTLDDLDSLGGADLELTDGVTLSMFLAQAAGLDITGLNNTLTFLDRLVATDASFDASGWSVDVVMLLNLLVANRNVDLMLDGIQEGVEKVIYNGIGTVDGVTQTVTLTAGTTIPGFVVFNPTSNDTEIQNFVLNMSGGTEISGNLRLSTTDKEDGFGDQIRTYLETVTINSTGDAENILSGDTANVITGDLTSQGTGNQGSYTSIDNELLDVAINASQALVIEGDIVFESENGEDDFSGNDVDDAVAEVLVSGTADVEFGIDSSDADVDGVVVTNAGTGTVLVGLDDSEIDSDDDLTFTGTGDVDLFIENSSNFDLSDDDLSAVNEVFMDGNATVTVTLAQYLAIGATNFIADDNSGTTGTIHIVGVGSDPFDATGVNDGIVVGSITTLPGDVVLDPTTNLTGVTMIIVPEGGSVTLTAAQYAQLAGAGMIVGANGDDFTVNITGLTQAIVDAGFNITGITADTKTVTLGEALVSLTEATTALGDVSELTFNLADGQELIFENVAQVSPVTDDAMSVPGTGVTVNGDANTTATFYFDSGVDGDDTIDASGINTAVLKLLQGLVNDQDVELLQNIGEEVLVVIYDPVNSPGNVLGIDREVVVEAGVTVDGNLIFNDYQDTVEIRNLDLTLSGGSEIDGNLRLTTTDKAVGLTQHFLDSLTIRSEGTGTNTIDGNVSPFVIVENTVGTANSEDNELLVVNAIVDTDLVIDGDVQFSSLDTDGDADTATFTVSGTADMTIDHLDISEGAADDSVGTDGIGTLVIANNMTGSGSLTVLGGTPAILAGSAFESLVITGTGATVLGVDPTQSDEESIDSDTLSLIDASGSSGNLTMGKMINVDSQDFEFISGTGVTIVSVDDDALNANVVNGDTGWTFDFSNAAAGSQLHLGSDIDFTMGPLSINMGPNGTLYLDNTGPGVIDLTGIDLTFLGVNAIVLGDNLELILTAEQADGLNIVGDGSPLNAEVNIVDFTDVNGPVDTDLSGIAADISGTITFAAGEDDVTVGPLADLGAFSITLDDVGGDNDSLAGETIRFSTEAQATRDIIVNDSGALGSSSTNVVWLFDSIVAVGGIDTSGYSGLLGRLWFYADLLASEGGDVEQLFTTLPNAILRVDIETLAELNILLQSQAVNRVMEIVHFATVGDLTFSDMGVDPEEHLESLTLHLGGETTVGNIVINDVVDNPLDTDLTTINFDDLTIVSHRAVKTGDLLASELFQNDNDGTPEPIVGGVEHVQPDNINTVGNISVGAGNAGVDLVQVNIETLGITVLDDSSEGDGAAIDIGTITFGYTPGTGDPLTTGVELDVEGANDINIAAVIATDLDITSVTVDSGSFTGVLTAPGASPAVQLGANVETLTFTNDSEESDDAELEIDSDSSEEGNESITVHYVLNGVAGSVTIDADDVDVTDDIAIADAIADELDDLVGVNAVAVGDEVIVSRDTADLAGPSDFAFAGVQVEGDTESLDGFIDDFTTNDGGTIILGSATNAGVAGSNLSLIDANDFGGTLDLGVISSLDGTGTDNDTDVGSAVDSLTDDPAFVFNSGTGLTTLTIDAVVGQGTPTLVTGSTWTFDMSEAAVGSTVTIGDGAVIQDGAFLEFFNATVVIDGNVDLSDVNLAFDDSNGPLPSAIWIPEGSTLTLDVDQLYDGAVLPANFRIYGSGTLHLIGDASNITLGAFIEVVNVDLSDVTIITDDLVVGNDGDDTLEFDVSGLIAEDDDGNDVGYVITGSAFNDVIQGSTGSDSIDGAAGDDQLFGGNPFLSEDADTLVGGSGTNELIDSTGNTLFVSNNAGVDTADGIFQDVNTGDVITVAAGASVTAEVENDLADEFGLPPIVPGFVATAETTNAGTATLTIEETSLSGLIDLTVAGGPNGYVIIGSDTDGEVIDSGAGTSGGDTLIGSAFADTIRGSGITDSGDSLETSGGADVLTGNGGNDVFEFYTQTTIPLDLTDVDTTDGVDTLRLNVVTDDADDTSESVIVRYYVGNVLTSVSLPTSLDYNNELAFRDALLQAIQLNSNSVNYTATAGATDDEIVIVGDAGFRIDFLTTEANGTVLSLDVTANDAVGDTAQVTELTVPNGVVTPGETYDVSIQLSDGTDIDIPAYEVQPGDDYLIVAQGITDLLNAQSNGEISALNVAGVITITDMNADNGGFTISFAFGTGSFGGSSASEGTVWETADLITDFDAAGNDVIDLNLVAGTSDNFEADGVEASFADALAAAQAEFTADSDLVYFFNWVANDENTTEANDQVGFLYFDGNNDGAIDGLIKLAGVTEMDANDIVA